MFYKEAKNTLTEIDEIYEDFVHTLFTTDRYNVLKDKGKGYSKRVLKVYSMK